MVFGKQDTNDGIEKSTNGTSRSILMPISETKLDEMTSNNDRSINSGSKPVAIQPENVTMNLLPRYDASVPNPILSLNRIQNIVSD